MKIETNEQLLACLDAITDALVRGDVESKMDEPDWRSTNCLYVSVLGIDPQYRLKPKPREFTIHFDSNGNPTHTNDLYEIVTRKMRVREVIE